MSAAKKFGTFGGVFTPSILTILGVIMYLRLPSIVGQAGLVSTIGIIVVAHIISVATGLSVASIATDKKVQAGGTYYMLSRSIGLPIGGTLGLALFVGLSFSVSLYVIGFSESFLGYWGWEVSKNTIRIAGSITLIAVTVVTLISTALALKAQFFIMAAIVISLLSIVFGSHDLGPVDTIATTAPSAVPFIVLFGIFFPAVTGFEAGVSMSGDLRDPKKSIPSGTIWAIVVGLVVYIALAFFLTRTVSVDQLVNNPNVLLDISVFAPAVIAGIWGATISSALGSILGAPRILQATASDRIVHRFFAVGHGKENEPRHALILTFIIAEVGILIGELDVIARIVSMFFITTYGFLNLSCFIESWASPDFRPDFKIPKVVSLIGTIACFVVMIQLDFVAMIGATLLLGAVFLYLKRKELTLESGDTWEGFWSSLLRSGLQRLARSDVHERNWRPNILLFSFGTHAREHMMDFGVWLVRKRGLLSNFDLTVNPQSQRLQPRSAQSVEEDEEVEVGVFSRQLTCPDPYEAMESIATYYGFSGVEPNAVIMGWETNNKHPDRFLELLRRYRELDLNVLLLKIDAERGFGNNKSIDVWWKGDNNNISLTLSLIRFLTTSDSWTDATVRFLVINEGDTAYSDAIQSRMDGILEAFRINARAVVINNVVGRKPIHDIISYESASSDLTVIGMPAVAAPNAASYMDQTGRLVDRLGSVLLVSASSYFNELSVGIETSVRVSEDVANKHSAFRNTASRNTASRNTAFKDTASKQSASESALREELESDVLPSLTLPEDETLRWAVQRFDAGIAGLSDELAGQPMAAVADMHHVMAHDIADAVKRAFASVTKSLDKEDRPRIRRAVQRAQANLAYQAQEVLTSFVDQQLPLQQKVLDSALVKLRSGVRNIIRQTPEELSPGSGGEQTGEVGSDGFVRSMLRRGNAAIPFRNLVDVRSSNDYYSLVLSTIQGASGAVNELSETLLVQLRNTFDALQRVANDVEEGSTSTKALSDERTRIENEFEVILDEYRQRQQQIRRSLKVGTRQLAQKVASEVGRPGKTLRKKEEEERLASALVEAPERWSENQDLLLSRARLGVQLISFQHRLSTIVQRHEEVIALTLQNQLVKPLREVEADVMELVEDPNSDVTARIRTTDSVSQSFDPAGLYEELASDIRAAIDEIPESVRTLTEESVQSMVRHPLDEVDIITVSLRRVLDYSVKMEFLGPVQAELSAWPSRAQRSFAASRDILRLLKFQASDESQEVDGAPVLDTDATVLQKGLTRLQALLSQLGDETTALRDLIDTSLDRVLQRLNLYTITRTEGELDRYVRAHTSRELQSRVRESADRVQGYIRNRFVRLLYSRSEGVLLARQLQEADPYLGSAALEGLQLVESVSPKDAPTRELPMYYRQLFLDFPTITQEFWVGADAQLARANQAVDRWHRGKSGGLLILGEASAGKTALSQLVAQTNFKRDEIFQLNAMAGGSVDPVVLERRMRETLGVSGPIESWSTQLPAHSVIIVNDLERWWERAAGGTTALERLEQIMELLGKRCLFIVNANVYAFKLIDRIYPLSRRFLDIVTRMPSNAEQIKEVVMLRHRSAGLRFILDGEQEEDVSEWKLAKLFTSLFDFSRGNIGAALLGWITAIKQVTADGLHVEPVEVPDLSIVDTVSPLQKALLIHIMMHGGLTMDRLRRISQIDDTLLHHELQSLKRLGWVVEANDVMSIDRFLRAHLTRAFVERRMIG